MTRIALFSLLLLSACGVDGAPVAATGEVTPGITLGGSVEAGIARDGATPADDYPSGEFGFAEER